MDVTLATLDRDRRTRAAALLLRQATTEIDAAVRPRGPELSIGRLMRSLIYSPTGQYEARDEWRAADANAEKLEDGVRGRFASCRARRDCAILDWNWLRSATRAMSTVPGAKGGYMVGVEHLPPVDPLWQDSVIGATGVQIIEGLTGNATIPRGTAAVATTWQAPEGNAPTAVDTTLGSASVTQKTVLATIKCSVQLVRQAPSLQDFLIRLLLRSVRSALDNALLQGSGASGQPQGLANLPTALGIQQVSGTSLAWAGILNAQRLASVSGVRDSNMTWIGAPTVRETLAQREKITTSGRFVWEGGSIAGNLAIATPDAPASTLFVGDFSTAVLALWGPGIEIRFDPHNDFDGARVAFQVVCMCDIVFPQPAAYVRIATIT